MVEAVEAQTDSIVTVVDSADVESGCVGEDPGPGHLGSSAPQPLVRVVGPARIDGARPAILRAAALALGLLSAWFLLYAAFLSSLQAHGTQGRLYAMYRSELANETAPYEAPIPAGDPVALMSVARLGIDHMVIVEGTTSRQLRSGPGHEVDTPLPGQVGTSVLMGRSFSYGGPFSGISSLGKGDEIVLTNDSPRYISLPSRRRTSPRGSSASTRSGCRRLAHSHHFVGWMARATHPGRIGVRGRVAGRE